MQAITRHGSLRERLSEILSKKENQIAIDLLSALSKATQTRS